MPFLITCEKCGAENQLGRMHCSQCGAKLEIKDPRTQAKPQRKGGVGSVIRILVVLALLLAIVMMLRPVVSNGAEGGLQDAQRLQQKMRTLKSAIMDRKAVTQRISEAEINGYFSDLLRRAPPEGGAMTLTRINMELVDGRAIVVLESRLGPVRITYKITGRPDTSGDTLQFPIDSVQVGQLPLPQPLGGWVAGSVGVVFSNMADERRILGELSKLDVGAGEATAVTGGMP